MTSTALDLRDRSHVEIITIVGLCVATAFAIVHWPWIVAGVMGGVLMLMLVVTRPLILVALMLAIGPADLSFVTGGFKALFPEVGGLDMNGIRLLGVTAGFVLLCLMQRSMQQQIIGKHGRWYALFLLWAAASLATSLSPLDGLRLLLKLAYPFLIFLVVAGMVEKEEELELLMFWTLATSLAIIAINPLMLVGVAYTVDDSGYKRLGGLGTHANPFSFYLMAVLLISLARFIVRGQSRYLVLCTLLGMWIYLTLTRITLLALLVAIAAMVVYAALERRSYRALVGGVLVALVIGIPFVPPVLERSLGFMPTPGEIVALVRSPAAFYQSVNWQGRDALWPIVYGSFAGDRWTGLGLGSSIVVLKQYFNATVGHLPHNEYLRLSSETGLIGVGLYFTAIMSWLVGAWRAGWGAGARAREFALPAVAVIVGWAIVALTDNPFDYYAAFTQYVGFLVAGALVARRLEIQAGPAVQPT